MFNGDCLTWSKKDLQDLMRRKSGRLPCSSSLTGTLFLPQTNRSLDVWIVDLSANGVGIMASEYIAVGQEAIVRLKRTKAISLIPFEARILHCTTESDCCFRVGCRFNDPIDSVLWEYLVG
jgi:hypothetical protein